MASELDSREKQGGGAIATARFWRACEIRTPLSLQGGPLTLEFRRGGGPPGPFAHTVPSRGGDEHAHDYRHIGSGCGYIPGVSRRVRRSVHDRPGHGAQPELAGRPDGDRRRPVSLDRGDGGGGRGPDPLGPPVGDPAGDRPAPSALLPAVAAH